MTPAALTSNANYAKLDALPGTLDLAALESLMVVLVDLADTVRASLGRRLTLQEAKPWLFIAEAVESSAIMGVILKALPPIRNPINHLRRCLRTLAPQLAPANPKTRTESTSTRSKVNF
jgi:hypothetical protein